MMQSPVSDIPPASASPRSSTPNSPNNNNATTKNGHANETQFPKFEPIRLERPQPTKFDGILLARFHDPSADDSELKNNRPLIYPKDMGDLENSAKFSIERLKQLTNHSSLNRLSPSEDSNQSAAGGGGGGIKYSQETPSSVAVANKSSSNHHRLSSPKKCTDAADTTNAITSNPHQNNQLNFHHPFPIKYPMSTTPTMLPHAVADGMDIERFKLARSMTNGRDLSDFGFRIQLGAFQSNYAHSDTSEELVVDENNELSSSATPITDIPTVSSVFLLILSAKTVKILRIVREKGRILMT